MRQQHEAGCAEEEENNDEPNFEEEGGVSRREAAMLLIRGNLGPGALALPYAIARCGWVFGTIALLGTVMQGVYSMMLLASCEKELWRRREERGGVKERLSLGEIAEEAMGPRAKNAMDFFVFVVQWGTCCVYVSLISENVAAFQWWQLGRVSTILLLTPLFLAMGAVDSMSQLAWTTKLGNAVMFAVVIAATCAGVGALWGGSAPRGMPVEGASDVILVISTSFYAFEGVGLVLPIAKSMAEPSELGPTISTAAVVLVTAYSLIGFSCGLGFRGRLGSGSITAFLAREYSGALGYLFDALDVLVTLAVLATFSLQLLPAAEVFATWTRPCTPPEDAVLAHRAAEEDEGVVISPFDVDAPLSEVASPLSYTPIVTTADDEVVPVVAVTIKASLGQRCFLVLAACGLALAVPSVGLLVALFGSFGQTALAAAPPLCRLALQRGPKQQSSFPRSSLAQNVLDVSVVAFCTAVMILGSILATRDIIQAYAS